MHVGILLPISWLRKGFKDHRRDAPIISSSCEVGCSRLVDDHGAARSVSGRGNGRCRETTIVVDSAESDVGGNLRQELDDSTRNVIRRFGNGGKASGGDVGNK